MATRSPKTQDGMEIPHERSNLHSLLAINPNYFGGLPNLGFPPQFEKFGDTSFEDLSCVAYSPERDRLEATVQIRRPFGYSGDLCSAGSHEHVRFYVSYDNGATFDDAGVASISVHDIPDGTDCEKQPWHPISYVVGVPYQPRREWCGVPVLPLVRAILSWEIVPDPHTPDQIPIWGDVDECHIQIKPRRFHFPDLVGVLSEKILTKFPPYLIQQFPSPLPDPEPHPALTLAETVTLYGAHATDFQVPAHRFVLPHLAAAQTGGAQTLKSYVPSAQLATELNIDLAAVVAQLAEDSGNTSFEELECLGLDNNVEQLVATFRIKQPNGFSGGPCTGGSTEYVAFWADFGEDCHYTYLGTAAVNTHDYQTLPDGGLCYAAVLPVDLGKYRSSCDKPVIARVRAVLSWATPPSVTDADALPFWGNRLDTHVQVRPGHVYDGTARFTIVGGVAAASVDLGSGLTLAGAAIAENGAPLLADSPFAGVVTFHGPLDPALAGQLYRIRVRNVTTGSAVSDLLEPFYVVNWLGIGSSVTPGAGGWSSWPNWMGNTTGKLGHFTPGGDDLWEVQLEVFGLGVVDVRRVQMDNTLNNDTITGDVNNMADLTLFTAGACRVTPGLLNGSFVARDKHFASWSIGVIGGPDPIVPPTPVSVGIAANVQTSVVGQSFTIDLSLLKPCGYVIQLGISDRAVVNSAYSGRTVVVNRGICMEKVHL